MCDNMPHVFYLPPQATTIRQEWPGWCHFLIAFLILMAAIWIPLVALLRMCGIHLLSEEEPSWFPADELRDFHGLMPHKVSTIEKCLFCIKEEEEHDEMWEEHTHWERKGWLLHLCNLASGIRGNTLYQWVRTGKLHKSNVGLCWF